MRSIDEWIGRLPRQTPADAYGHGAGFKELMRQRHVANTSALHYGHGVCFIDPDRREQDSEILAALSRDDGSVHRSEDCNKSRGDGR